MPSDHPTKRPSRVLRFAVSAALLVAPAGGLAACGGDQEPQHTINEPEPPDETPNEVNEPEELEPEEARHTVNEPMRVDPPATDEATTDQGNEPSDPALRNPRTNLPASEMMGEE